MPFVNAGNKTQELEDVNKAISELLPKIDDQEFKLNPIKKKFALTSALDRKSEKTKEAIESFQNLITSAEALNSKLKEDLSEQSLNMLKNEINAKRDVIQEQKNILDSLKKEREDLEHQLNKFDNNEDYKQYHELFKKRFKLQKELDIDQQKTATELQAIKNTLNPENTSSLAYKIRQKLNEDKDWFERLKTRHGFELSPTKTDGATKVEFISKNGACIEIDENTVRFKGEMTTANMKDITPTMIVLFLKSTEGSNTHGCRIAGDSEDVKKYLMQMLATELMKQSSNNSSYMINGMTVDEILHPKTPALKNQHIETEKTEPQMDKRM